MKKLFLLILVFYLFNPAFSQERYFDLYLYNLKTINPAFTGVKNEQNFDAQYQRDIDYPKYNSESLISYSNKYNKIKSAFGLIFLNKKLGSLTNSNVSLLYSYQFNLNNKSKLTLGIEPRYQKQYLDYSFYQSIDPLISLNSASTSTNLDFDFGILYQLNKLYISLSCKNMLHPKSTDFGVGLPSHFVRTYNIYAMNEFALNRWLKINPSILYNTDLQNSWYVDLNSTIEIKKTLLLGFTEKILDNSLHGYYNAGVNIKDKVQLMTLVYSGSNHSVSSSGILEFMVRVKISNE